MTGIVLRDHMGTEHAIRDGEDVNRVVATVYREALRLAELMLGSDRQSAIAAEVASDRLEDIFMPVFADDVVHIAALLARRDEDERRRAKALAIKARGAMPS